MNRFYLTGQIIFWTVFSFMNAAFIENLTEIETDLQDIVKNSGRLCETRFEAGAEAFDFIDFLFWIELNAGVEEKTSTTAGACGGMYVREIDTGYLTN